MLLRFGIVSSAIVTFSILLCGCESGNAPEKSPALTVQSVDESLPNPNEFDDSDARSASVRHFCGNCHVVPLPQSFPKDAWYDEVRRGFRFYSESGRTDLQPPSQSSVVSFYQDHAPDELHFADVPESAASSVSFRCSEVLIKNDDPDKPPAISFVDHRNGKGGAACLCVSDMRTGKFFEIAEPGRLDSPLIHLSDTTFRQWESVSHPAAVRQADLDGNGIEDLLFTDLGSFRPGDNSQGKVMWIPDGATETPGVPVEILGNVGRVADVAVGDFNGDGRPDVVVAEFGWHKTGGLHLLTNQESNDNDARFSTQLLDSRPGTIHVIPTDLNNDGRLDFLALISQEHEQIVSYLNLEAGFTPQLVYAAPDPSWGSSGISLADMDGDGDQDILYANGDAFDSLLMKPYHGVWLLENSGTGSFAVSRIAALPGVHRALAADFDSDGDMDIAACALLPPASFRGKEESQLQGLIWLEQTGPGRFLRHVIERGRPLYAAMCVTDLNHDQRPDIVVGCYYDNDTADSSVILKIFWNQ